MVRKYSLAYAAIRLESVRGAKKVVLAGGTYDILHPGHIEYLTWCKEHGDILVVCVSGDRRTKARKGDGRPVLPGTSRALMVENLKPVDIAFVSERRPFDDLIIDALRPNIVITTADEPSREKKEKFLKHFTTRHPHVRVILREGRRGPYVDLSSSLIIKRIRGG